MVMFATQMMSSLVAAQDRPVMTALAGGLKGENERVYTTRDGTTWDKYISYLKLDGT